MFKRAALRVHLYDSLDFEPNSDHPETHPLEYLGGKISVEKLAYRLRSAGSQLRSDGSGQPGKQTWAGNHPVVLFEDTVDRRFLTSELHKYRALSSGWF